MSSSSSLAGRTCQSVGLGAVGWAGGVAERGEGVLDDLLGQLARRVVGAGRAPVADLGDDQRPSREHGGQAAQVTAEQAAQRPDPLRQVRVVVAGGVEGRQILGRIAHGLAQCPRAGIADLGQPLEEVAVFGGLLDLSQGEFWFELADEAEVGLVHPQAGELQQALVHVPDLLDVQALVGQPFGGAAAAPQDEQGAEDLVHDPVGDGEPFQPRVARGVEQAAAVGRDAHVDVLAAFVHGGEGGQQAGPGGGAAVADLVAVQVLLGVELVVQAGHRVRGGVQVGGDRQQPLLFRVEQEHQAHHHGERAPVHLARRDLAEQGAAGLAVEPRQLADEQLGGLPDLDAQGGGDFGLCLGAAGEQCRQAGAV